MKSHVKLHRLALASFFGMMTTCSVYATTPERILFVLDASNSMWGHIKEQSKIEIAKNVLQNMANDLPKNTEIALAAYGHNSEHTKRDCTDMGLLSSYGAADRADFQNTLASIQPKGQTPIAATLLEAKSWVSAGTAGQDQTTLVLITDGMESCDGDPCMSAKQLTETGINVTLHVVGFDLTDEQKKAVSCISDLGGGQYVDARNADELQLAVSKVTEFDDTNKINNPHFVDNFSGEEIKPHWAILNEDNELFIIEEDELLLVGAGIQALSNPEATNIFTLENELPKGDWDINVDLKMRMQTGADIFEFGLYKDHENHLILQYYLDLGDWCKRIAATFSKVSKGKPTSSTQLISANSGHCGAQVNPDTQTMIDTHINDGFRITLSKRGRQYFALTTLDGISTEGKPLSFKSNSLSSLRSPGKPTFITGQFRDAGGETLIHMDRIEIISVGEK